MAKSSGNRTKWILLTMVAVAAVLYFFVPNKAAQETKAPVDKYKLEKTGAGVVADYTASSQRIHAAVDRGLAGAQLTWKNGQENNREVPRKEVEGTIRWHARNVLLTVPADTKLETVQQALQAPLKAAGGEVLASQPDSYQGMAVVRIDVGVRDKLAGDDLTLITDRIYVSGAKKPDALPAKPGGATQGVMALLIDDFGYNAEPIAAYIAIQRPITFAVIPYRPHSNEAASRALAAGQQVMLHLPMEPLSAAEQSEPITVTASMSDQEIQQTVTKAIQSLPGLVGVNNHQGSKATADKRVMRLALGVIKANNLFFIDSRTNSQSVALETARQLGMRSGANEIFLDNSSDIDYIKGQLRTAMRMALQHGSVMAIGHARPNTAIAIREMIPEIEAAGIKLVFASQMVK